VSNTPNPAVDSMLELVVTEGFQQGSRIGLRRSQSVSVGMRLDCDVVLESGRLLMNSPYIPGTEPVIKLQQHHTEVELEVLNGEVQLGQTLLRVGDREWATAGQKIRIGSSAVQLVPVGDDDPTITQSDPTDTDVRPQSLMASTEKRSGLSRKLTLVAGLVVGAVLIMVGAGQALINPVVVAQISDPPGDLVDQLSTSGFDGITLNALSDDRIVLSGFLPTRARLIELKTLAGALGEQVTVDVQVGEELQEAVAVVYRVHGVQAEVTATAAGTVSVITAEADVALLQSIEQSAYQDIADLETVILNNTPPVPVDAPVTETLPGKRIVSVIATEPAHILTEDGTRYFPGAILPNGFKIIAIREQMVDLVRNDERIELVF